MNYLEKFSQAIKNTKAKDFTQRTMVEHYAQAIIFHHPKASELDSEEITHKCSNLLEKIFTEILATVDDSEKLPSILLALGRKQPERIIEWFPEFDEAYDNYKEASKMSSLGSFFLPELQNTSSLLDFGCGGGEIGLNLAREAHIPKVSGVDVLDWRSPETKNTENYSFYPHDFATSRSEEIPSHDTGIMHAMLHHVSGNPNDISKYLKNTSNLISNKYLIVEDVLFDKQKDYSSLPGIDSLEKAKHSQKNFPLFLELDLETQRDIIITLDLLSNSLAMGIPEMHFPFGAQELSTWISIFDNAGLKLKKLKVLGFQSNLFHRMSQVLFIVTKS